MDKRALQLNRDFFFIVYKILEVERRELKAKKVNLTPRELWYIVLLHDSKTNLVKDILYEARINKSTLSIQLKILNRKGMVKMETSSHDRRVKMVTLTPKGRRAYKIHKQVRAYFVKQIYHLFTSDDFDYVINIGQRIIKQIKKLEDERKIK